MSDPAAAVLKTFGDGRLFGASFGDGQPWALALPGWTRTHQDFAAMLEGVDAIALDLPGFGAAPPPPEPWSTAQYADHIAPVLDEMAAGSVVVGHSFGGRVALHLATSHPDRVGALVLTGVPLVRETARRRRSPLAFRAGKALHRLGLIRESGMEGLRQRYGSADYRAAPGVMRTVLVTAVNETYEDQLRAFPGPIELVWGADDDQAPVSVARAAMAVRPDSRLTVCPGIGHFVPLRAPEVLREALERHHPPSRPPSGHPAKPDEAPRRPR